MPTGLTFTTGAAVTEVQMDTLNDFVNQLEADTLPSAWATVPYTAPWQTEASTNEALQVRYSATRAELKGVIQNSSATTTSSVVGTLPVGSRPSAVVRTAVDGPGTGTQLTRFRMDINTNGQIVIYGSHASFLNFFMAGASWSLG